jgi:hypothetical protein
MLSISDLLRLFLAKSSFASVKMMSPLFGRSALRVKETFVRELGVRKYTGRSIPHLLEATPKNNGRGSALKTGDES